MSDIQWTNLNKEINKYCDFLKEQRRVELLEAEERSKHPLSWELQKKQIEKSLAFFEIKE